MIVCYWFCDNPPVVLIALACWVLLTRVLPTSFCSDLVFFQAQGEAFSESSLSSWRSNKILICHMLLPLQQSHHPGQITRSRKRLEGVSQTLSPVPMAAPDNFYYLKDLLCASQDNLHWLWIPHFCRTKHYPISRHPTLPFLSVVDKCQSSRFLQGLYLWGFCLESYNIIVCFLSSSSAYHR